MQLQRLLGLSDMPEAENANNGCNEAYAARVRALALEAYDGGLDKAALVLMRTAELLAALQPPTGRARTGNDAGSDAGNEAGSGASAS